jgi:Family of unknown function (DUF6286)
MIRRPRRSIPATIVGLVLLAAAAAVAISCIQLAAGGRPLVPFSTVGDLVAGLSWNDPALLIAGGVLAVLGAVLLACALLPGTPKVLALAPSNEHTSAGVARRSLASDLTHHARGADGITDARVRVGARKVTVDARTPLQDRSGLSEQVRDLVVRRLDDIDLARPARVRVMIKPDRSAR